MRVQSQVLTEENMKNAWMYIHIALDKVKNIVHTEINNRAVNRFSQTTAIIDGCLISYSAGTDGNCELPGH